MDRPIIVRHRFTESTLDEYVAAELRYLSISKRAPLASLTSGRSRVLIAVGICYLGAGFFLLSIGVTQFLLIGVLMGCLCIALPFYESWTIRSRLKRSFHRDYRDAEFEWTIDSHQITVETRTAASHPVRTSFGWDKLSAVLDGPHGFLLYGTQFRCWLPLGGFVEVPQTEEFRSLVASKNLQVIPHT